MKEHNEDGYQEWITSDYHVAAFLMSHGLKVVGLDDGEDRKRFIFDDPDPELREELIRRFRVGADDAVSANTLFFMQKRLQRLLRG